MDPTMIYNNYHLERRKMFENNPRNNLKSTIDFVWKESLEVGMSPKENIERRRVEERRMIGQRSNELIKKRLMKEVNVMDQYQHHKQQQQNVDTLSKHLQMYQQFKTYIHPPERSRSILQNYRYQSQKPSIKDNKNSQSNQTQRQVQERRSSSMINSSRMSMNSNRSNINYFDQFERKNFLTKYLDNRLLGKYSLAVGNGIEE